MNIDVESYDSIVRRKILARFREYFDNGFRDPALLYLGVRFGASLGLAAEAHRFLEPLEQLLHNGDRSAPGYAAIGLIRRALLLEGEERGAIDQRLSDLAAIDPTVAKVLRDIENDPETARVRELRHATASAQAAKVRALLNDQATQTADGKPIDLQRIHKLAAQATASYHARRIAQARYALEEILLADGDQPDALRNLVTIASEQQDAEAYERYWHRYVRVQLSRIACNQGVDGAWEDLAHFYTRVVEAMDRELDKSINEITSILPRPGFLPRWLEALGGLIWLEAAAKSRRAWQTGLDEARLVERRQGHLAVMRYWLRIFYPEFELLLDTGQDDGLYVPLPSPEMQLVLNFNPAVRLIRRFLEWSRFGFAIGQEDGPQRERHIEAVLALVGVVARTPAQFYATDKELAKALPHEPGSETKSLRSLIQEACSYPLHAFRFSKLLEAQDWQAIVDHFADPDMAEHVTPSLRMFVAIAYCRVERELDGLELASRTVAELTPADLEAGTQIAHLWENVLHACVGRALKATDFPPGMGRAKKFAPRSDRSLSQDVIEQWRKAITVAEDSAPAQARQIARALPDQPIQVAKAKAEILTMIDEIRRQKELIAAAWIDQVNERIGSMPAEAGVVNLRETTLRKVQMIYTQRVAINQGIDQMWDHIANRNFESARAVIERLPNTPEDLTEMKQHLFERVDHAAFNARLERTIEETKGLVARGDFAGARKLIRALPNAPQEIAELKGSLLGQIDQAEQQHGFMVLETARLKQRLISRGVSWYRVMQIAQANNIDMNDPVMLYQLLTAIDSQV
jgi:hypothetical protein